MAIIEDRYVNIEIQTNQVYVLEKLFDYFVEGVAA
jgi:hypothetical protein